jgi:tRNA(Ile)-lysidine synthase
MLSRESILIFSRSGLAKSIHQLINSGEKRITLACSGGPDSACLIGAAAVLIKRKVIDAADVVHVNHNIRQEAKKDLDVCRYQADFFGLPFYSYDIFPTKSLNRNNLYSICREMRYESLQNHSRCQNNDVILTAHHADDVAETIVMNLARGCGVDGLMAIRERNCVIGNFPVIRPFLSYRKNELQYICEKSNVEYAVDKSNFNQEKTRSFVRHSVIPVLEKVNPSFVKHVSKTAMIMQKSFDKNIDTHCHRDAIKSCL